MNLPTEGNVLGDQGAPVTVEEWADFQCPYCRQFALGPGRQLRNTSIAQGQAKLVFHDFAFLGPESVWAAEAAKCAQDQGKFWEYHDKLYEEQGPENSGTFDAPNLLQFAEELGLDIDSFRSCLLGNSKLSVVQQELDEGQQEGVQGTPTVFVNGQNIGTALESGELDAAVEQAAGK